jgi:hypothetical protein
MIIGITINNILRDHITQLRKAYSLLTEKEPIEPINPFDLETSFPTVESEIASQEFKPNNDTEMVLDMVANEQDDNFNVFEFMYEEASFEVFGRSDEAIDGLLNKLKSLEKKLKVEFVLLNKESPRSKCATLFFLSKNNFDFKKIYFPNKEKEFWSYVDVLITDTPKILKSKPKNKTSIKIQNDFNVDIKSDFTIIGLNDNLKELKNTIKTIKNNSKQ